MPLTTTGEETLKNFQREYGKTRGKQIFYAWLRKKPQYRNIMEKRR